MRFSVSLVPRLCQLIFGGLLAGCAAAATGGAPQTPPAAEVVATMPATTPLRTALDDYIARDEPAFAWREIPSAVKGNVTNLQVTSQQWQGTTWTHRVEIVRPARDEFPGRALMMISYGNGSQQESFFTQLAANAMGATIVNLWNVPNQPLFEKREDELIAYSFAQFMQLDADPTWPLLLPMTKSVTQSLKAIAQWTQKTNQTPLDQWVFSGASKRGWTSWLAAAALNAPDATVSSSASLSTAPKLKKPRVLGVIPMVYDNLNLALQMPHQKASWGRYSEQIADYTKQGLPDLVSTPRGQQLARIVDPFTYRARFTMPKLLVNASNDPYWPLDAFNLYRDQLSGPTNVFYAPNSGHALNGNEARVAGISIAWFRAIAGGQTLPQISAALLDAKTQPLPVKAGEVVSAPNKAQWRLQVLADSKTPQIKAARVWIAGSDTRDFRSAKWQSLPLKSASAAVPIVQSSTFTPTPQEFSLTLDELTRNQSGKFFAAFGEIEMQNPATRTTAKVAGLNLPFLLSSPVVIWTKNAP